MRKRSLAIVTLIATLGGCSAQQQQLACDLDGKIQPIAADVVTTLVPQTTAGVAIDNAVVHPAIAKYCASLGGTAVSASVAKP